MKLIGTGTMLGISCTSMLLVIAAFGAEPGQISVTIDASKMAPTGPVVHPTPLPEGDSGIAAKHPGDAHIDKDEGVLFAEDFGEPGIDTVAKRWTGGGIESSEALSLSDDAPASSPGKHSLEMTATRGKSVSAYLYKRFDPGVDAMYARAYVKFSEDHPYVQHLVTMGGWRNAGELPLSGAQYRHDGTRSFQTSLDLTGLWGRYAPPGAWFLYTYWPDMVSYQGPQGTAFYGNSFLPSPPQQAPRGQWQCLEFMIKINSTPERHDGEQALWIDGKLAGRWGPYMPAGRWVKDSFVIDQDGRPFDGFRWRTAPDLKANTFWLLYDMKAVFARDPQFAPKPGVKVNADATHVRFANVVIATQYIGPILPVAHALESTAAAMVASTDCRGCHY